MFKSSKYPILLCSKSIARQRFFSALGYLVYPLPHQLLSFIEPSLSGLNCRAAQSQHIDIINDKWGHAQKLIQAWKTLNTKLWSQCFAIVCDTVVYSPSGPFGKPQSRDRVFEMLASYKTQAPYVVSVCKGSFVDHGRFVRDFMVHETTYLEFIGDKHQEVLDFAKTYWPRLSRVAGGIDIEIFVQKGWVGLMKGGIENVIGVPWTPLQPILERRGS